MKTRIVVACDRSAAFFFGTPRENTLDGKNGRSEPKTWTKHSSLEPRWYKKKRLQDRRTKARMSVTRPNDGTPQRKYHTGTTHVHTRTDSRGVSLAFKHTWWCRNTMSWCKKRLPVTCCNHEGSAPAALGLCFVFLFVFVPRTYGAGVCSLLSAVERVIIFGLIVPWGRGWRERRGSNGRKDGEHAAGGFRGARVSLGRRELSLNSTRG